MKSSQPPAARSASPAVAGVDRITWTTRPVHEARNALAIVAMNVEFAMGEVERGDHNRALVVEALREALEAVQRLTATVDPDVVSKRDQPSESGVVAGIPRVAAAAVSPGSTQARVLVVDDEPGVGAALRRCLRGSDVVVTENAAEALARLRRGERFDVVFCDLMMPGMRGDQLYAEVVRTAPEQAERFVFVTGGATDRATAEFLARVPNTIVEKPFHIDNLREIVKGRMAGRGRR